MEYICFYIFDKMFYCDVFIFVFKVFMKKDFLFIKVLVLRVNYVDDIELQVILKCLFQFLKWGNVFFEVQWFVNGSGLMFIRICGN